MTITANQTLRWGMIGCGDVAERKSAPALQQVSGSELVAVMARSAERVADYAQRHNVERWYTSADALINDPNVNAVYIATPPDSHCEYALKVAAAGKICCVEKPMALNFSECEQMQAAFTAANVPLFVAYYRRTLPGFSHIHQRLAQGAIGKPLHIHWRYCRPAHPRDSLSEYNWRTDPKVAPGGYFDDIGCHGLDLFSFLLGDVLPKSVHAAGGNQMNHYLAPDAISCTYQFTSGCTASCQWHFNSFTREDWVVIDGDKGRLEFSVFEDTPARLTTTNGTEMIAMDKPEPVQLFHAQAMLDHIQGNHTHPSLGNSAAQTNLLMELIVSAVTRQTL